MLTTDLALRFDPVYEQISRRFHENPDEFADAFARAWFKLTHRDMGPIAALPRPARSRRRRCSGRTRSRRSTTSWSTPTTSPRSRRRSSPRACRSRSWSPPRGRRPRRSAAATSAAAPTAPASASSRRAAGRSTTPTSWRTVLRTLEGIQQDVQRRADRRQAGLARRPDRARRRAPRVEKAAKDAGHDVEVPFTPGRTDASQEQTDVESFAALEPTADGFRNYLGKGNRLPAEYLLVDRANLLTLSAPEMTVLVGGLRVLGANHEQSPLGVLTDTPGYADQRLLRQPARPGHDVDGDVRRRRTPSRAATAPPARSSGPAAAPTSSSARTPSCARSPRSTRATTRRRSSCATSSPRGSRS